MADLSPALIQNGKLEALNKQIIEIKKKINLSEGQRKANFEECDVKKRENAERLSRLKKEVKELRMEFARAKNSDESADHAVQLSRRFSANIKKGNLVETIQNVDEEIVRYRKEIDLTKYRLEKKRNKLEVLLQQYEELMSGDVRKVMKKRAEVPLKKQIIKLENQLLRVNVMQMEADIVRKKYKNVKWSLKKDAELYGSWLRKLEDEIKEQYNEIKRLKKIKEEAAALRNATKEELVKQEAESIIVREQQENLIQDYRKQVEERKIEVESLERMPPPINRHLIKYENDEDEDNDAKNIPENRVSELEEIFNQLRNATGVTKTENVLQRFLNQRATKERLTQMQETAEKEKMILEKKRQQLTAEIEMRKFSESKDADQNAEKLEKLNSQISEQLQRKEKAIQKKQKIENLLTEIKQCLSNLCSKCKEMNDTEIFDSYVNLDDPEQLLLVLCNGMKQFLKNYQNLENAIDMTNDVISKKLEVVSMKTASTDETVAQQDDRSLFPMFSLITTPVGQQQPSEDEEEIPSRNTLKRQAQLLVDTKSRRKMFNIKR